MTVLKPFISASLLILHVRLTFHYVPGAHEDLPKLGFPSSAFNQFIAFSSFHARRLLQNLSSNVGQWRTQPDVLK